MSGKDSSLPRGSARYEVLTRELVRSAQFVRHPGLRNQSFLTMKLRPARLWTAMWSPLLHSMMVEPRLAAARLAAARLAAACAVAEPADGATATKAGKAAARAVRMTSILRRCGAPYPMRPPSG